MDIGIILDWLRAEGGYIVTWWLLVTLAGAAVWPLLYRVLGGLPDRGYTLARVAGLMLIGFVFWFLGVLGFLQNTTGGMVFAWIVVIVISLAAFFGWDDRPSVGEWFREHRALVIVTELLFVLLLVGWATYRAHNPEMYSTEKPMETMFINSIRASETFPPHDAWLSGYAISYYYFGYVIIAMLADLGAVSTGIAFTLTIALIFALTGISVLGVVYNLVRIGTSARRRGTVPAALGAGMLGVGFLILMGNLGTALVEFPYQGYVPEVASQAYFDFWDVPERAGTITVDTDDGSIETVPDTDGDGIADWDDGTLDLDRWSFTWGVGWRYSRIVNDRQLDGSPVGAAPITESPSFSFVLADLHPHVLALPFAVLAIGLALNLVLAGRELARWEYPLYAIWVGGMIFMNSWDAVYLPLLIGAEVLRRLVQRGTGVLEVEDLWKSARFAGIMIGLTVVFYLPWLISFTSQASGILPNVIYPTRWTQYFIHFGTFIVILSVYLAVEAVRARDRLNWQAAGMLVAGVGLTIAVVLPAMALIAWERDDVRYAVYSVGSQAGGLRNLWPDVLERRLIGLPSEILLIAFMAVVVGRLFARRNQATVAEVPLEERMMGSDLVLRVRAINFSAATGFVLLLTGAAALLTLGPDFVYLRDNFAVRINTVFKLYYQGWIMFSITSAFAVWSVVAGGIAPGIYDLGALLRGELESFDDEFDDDPRKDKPKRGATVNPVQIAVPLGQIVFLTVVVLLFIGGLLYTIFAARGRALVDTQRMATKASIERCEDDGGENCGTLRPLTLDGAPTMISATEYAAVQCLASLEDSGDAVLVEAPCHCGYHPEIGRFSALTGIPTLMGWGNHEGQWRGDSLPEMIDTRIENGQRRDRFTDVNELYTTQDWSVAWELIDRYGIDYIVVGDAERNLIRELAGDNLGLQREYNLGLEKFAQVLMPVCDAGSTTVYRVAPE